LYARAGIPECWIANVQDALIEVHTNPSGSSYGLVRRFGRDESLSPRAFPDLSVPVDEIFS
jgi:Uma2 family endonuclease